MVSRIAPDVRQRSALPLGRVCVISSRTTIGVALLPAIFALCSKCDVLVKDREDHLIAAFFETLGDELAELRDAATAQTWSGDDDAIDLSGFDVGRCIRERCYSRASRVKAASSGALHPIWFESERRLCSARSIERRIRGTSHAHAARRATSSFTRAKDVFRFTRSSSKPAARSRSSGSPRCVADALGAAAIEFPPAALDAPTAARLAVARDLATFRAGADRVYSDPHPGCLAILDPPFEEPPLFLPRTIGIRSVDNPSQAAEYLERHGIALEALAVAGRRPDLLELAARAESRPGSLAFGTLQAPPLGVFHGGRPRIAEFVRWIGNET